MNWGPDIPSKLDTVLGTYDLIPPPGVGGFGFKSLVKGVKKAGKAVGKGTVKAVKATGKGVAKGAKAVGKGVKFVAEKAAYAAATPVRVAFKKFAMRRARLLSWRDRQSMDPNAAEKKEAAAWALGKLRAKGPFGVVVVKMLTATKGATLGGVSGAFVGMTGVEIAAIAGAAVSLLQFLMNSLNKPGQAPADPRVEEAAPEVETVIVTEEEAPAEEEGTPPPL